MQTLQSQVPTLDKQLAQIADFKAFMGTMKREGKKMSENRDVENFRKWMGVPLPGPEKTIEMPRVEMALREEIERLKRNENSLQVLAEEQRQVILEQNRELVLLRALKNSWNIPGAVKPSKTLVAWGWR